MGHNRKLSFTHFKDKSIDDKYILWSYGDFIIKKNNPVLYIECFIVKNNQKHSSCSVKGYYYDNVETIIIEFTKSLLFPSGTYLDSTGRVLNYPVRNFIGRSLNGKYKIENLYFNASNPSYFKSSNLIEKISGGNLPDIDLHLDGRKLLSSYYSYFNSKSNTEYIIQSDVIFRYFFGFSTLVYDIVINNKIRYFLKHKTIIVNNVKTEFVFYDSDLISPEEVRFLAKYLFIKDNFALKTIQNTYNEIYKERLKDNSKEAFAPFSFKFPISLQFSLNVIGQYISVYGDIKKKFVVTEIISINPSNPNEFIFSTQKIVLKDIKDKNVKDNEEDEEEKIKSVTDFENKVDKIFNGNNPGPETNTKITSSIINEENYQREETPFFEQNLFLETPLFEDTEIINLGETEVNNIFNRPPSPENVKNNTTLKNYRYYKIDWFYVIEQVVELLKQDLKFNVEMSKSTFMKIDYYAIDIMIENKYYKLLEFGNGYYTPIFRKKTFEEIKIETLNKILNVASKIHFSWPEIYNSNEMKDFDIVFLTSNKHSVYEIENRQLPDMDKIIFETYDKTKTKILKDLINQ